MKFKLITTIDRINYFSDNFISYYKKFFTPDEFYFLVHYKNYDQLTDYLKSHGFSHFEKHNITSFGEGHNVVNQNKIQQKLINEGHIIIYVDIDERVIHPKLKEYIINCPSDIIVPTGMMIVQRDFDPPLDKMKGVLEQQRVCKIDTKWYSKACILKKPFEWHHGRHNKPEGCIINSDVYLVDLGRVCVDLAIENNIKNKEIYKNVTSRYSEKNKKLIENKLFNPVRSDLKEIPEYIKSLNLF